jgi:hypothetical protein
MVATGTILSERYLIHHEIGSGGMGAVYEATDLRTGGTVAVKLLHPPYARNPEFVARLRREAQIAASIRTPRAVRVIDLHEHEGTPFLVMEYVGGESVADRLARLGRLPVDEALAVCVEVARALEGAYAAGVVHRDLKPANIKITDEGEVKVLDFGIARADYLPGITATDTFIGTPEYSAPERLDGSGDIRSDIYSLGVILYEMLAGVRPFTAPTGFALLRQHESAPVPPLPVAVPTEVQAILDRSLAKRPQDRYQTPAELLGSLHAARAAIGKPDTRPLPSPLRPAGPPRPAAATDHAPDDDRAIAPTMLHPARAADRPLSSPDAPAPAPARRGRGRGTRTNRTLTRAPGMVGPTPDGSGGRLGARAPVLVGSALALIVALGAAVLYVRAGSDDDRARGGTIGPAAAAATVAAGASPASSPPPTATPGPPPLLAPGQQIELDAVSEADLRLYPENCPGVADPPHVTLRLTVTGIARDADDPRRVTVSYVRRVSPTPGTRCVLAYDPDAYGNIVALETLQRAGGRDVTYRTYSSDGTGLSVTGADNLIGREYAGTWVFDGVELNGRELSLVQRLPDETVVHKIKLLPVDR